MPRRLTIGITAVLLVVLIFYVAVLTPVTAPEDAPLEPTPMPRLPLVSPAEADMAPDLAARVNSLMQGAIAARAFPGSAVAIGRTDGIVLLEGYGRHTYEGGPAVSATSVFDIASLTKVIATTTAAMLLYEEGRLDLSAPVASYVPAFVANGKADVTIRHLLTHTSGLPSFRPFHTLGYTTRDAVLDAVLSAPLARPPGSKVVYSDFGMITLMLVVEAITGQTFDAYVRANIFAPLGMDDTGFRPPGATDTTIVPTEREATFRGRLLQGEVHDETAWLLGGVSGHAGLFSTAEDLARFGLMLVRGGRIGSQRFLSEETIRLFTTRAAPSGATGRALGWDLKSPTGYSSAGTRFGLQSFGHTGFTGTSLWVDPEAELFVVLLSNRVYPTRDNRRHTAVRANLADAAYAALLNPPGASRIESEALSAE